MRPIAIGLTAALALAALIPGRRDLGAEGEGPPPPLSTPRPARPA